MFDLLRSKKSPIGYEGPPSTGENQRVYAIGDIHGRIDLLLDLMDQIGKDDWRNGFREKTSLIFLGDYVDRGPNSREVIEFILKLRDKWPDTICLMGNHEQVFLMALNGDEQAVRFMLRDGMGGRETLMSYGATQTHFDTLDSAGLWEWMTEVVPQSHKDFLAGLSKQVIVGNYAFVHAGIQPGVAMAEQEDTDLLWIRDPFLNFAGAHSHMIVHGHSISDDVDTRTNRIGIDTGAYNSGKLTALALEGTTQRILQAIGAPGPESIAGVKPTD